MKGSVAQVFRVPDSSLLRVGVLTFCIPELSSSHRPYVAYTSKITGKISGRLDVCLFR
jgi:hypothetical protein